MLFQLCVCVCMWCGRGVVVVVCGVVVSVVLLWCVWCCCACGPEKNREKNVCCSQHASVRVDARVFPAVVLMKLRSPSFKS